MNWLVELFDRMLAWLPRPTLLDPSEGGLKISHGKLRVLEGGKRYWYVPLFQDIKTFPVVEQTADLPAQTLMSANKKPLLVSGIVVYEVTDVLTVLTRAHDVDDIVADVGRATIAEVLTGQPFQTLLDGQRDGSTARALAVTLRRRLKRYGIHVLRASLNELSPCAVVRVVGGANALPGLPSTTSDDDDS